MPGSSPVQAPTPRAKARGRCWLSKRLGYTLTIHLTDGSTVEGVLSTDAADCLVLTAARFLDDSPVPLAGEVAIPRNRILFMQANTKEQR